MEILWWLAPTAVATALAMVWATWAGRPRQEGRDRSEAAYERFSAAIERDHPAARKARPVRRSDPSTGIAVRPSRRADDGEVTRSDRLPAQSRRRSAAEPADELVEEPQAG